MRSPIPISCGGCSLAALFTASKREPAAFNRMIGRQPAMTHSIHLNDISIHRIIEQEPPFLSALDMFPSLSTDLLDSNRHWLMPNALDSNGMLRLCFQSYVVRTPHHVILVDSCIGNDKERPLRPQWHMKRDGTFMSALAAAGF